ncbi:hypothetical protein [Roseibium sp.]|uniref:hypothetical protein n=1 Tax=Roseibium sp. TaxID=1936156 RepID=UPI003A976B25
MLELHNLSSDNERDIDRLIGFLAEYDDPGVRMRPRDAVDAALETGLALALIRDGKILGCSLVYDFFENVDGPVFSEIGTMRVTLNGQGLQNLLSYFHLVQISLEDDFSPDHNVFAVVQPNTASEHNLKTKVGMKPWQPPEVLQRLRRSAGVPFAAEKYCLVAPPNCRKAAFKNLRDLLIGDRLFKTPKGEGRLLIKTGWFSNDLLDIDFDDD